MPRILAIAIAATLLSLAPALSLLAQEEEEAEAKPKVWSNQADLGGVLTGGNSRTSSLSIDNVLIGQWARSRFRFAFGGYMLVKQDDDNIAVGTEDDFVVIEDDTSDVDQQRLYVTGEYRRDISTAFFWMTGASWDRDIDAGIESRSVLYAGVGNQWWDREDLKFSTNYAISYEARDDEIPDPETDRSFPAARLTWDYLNRFGDNTTLTNDYQFSLNVATPTDFRFNTTTALTVSMSERFALRTSFQFRYQNLPALEEIDLYNLDPSDPDSSVTGTVLARKRKLDSIFKVTLVVNF